jgi:outer membrane protein TolC
MEASIKALGGAIEFSRRLNAPALTFNANLSTRGEEDPLTNQTSNLGIGISWPLGDGGLAAARTREARANRAVAEAELRTLVLSIVGEVVAASFEVTAAEQRLTTALIQVENARELLRISEGRYRGGVGDFLEVTDAQDALFAAERNRATAEADLQTARARLRRAVGISPVAENRTAKSRS